MSTERENYERAWHERRAGETSAAMHHAWRPIDRENPKHRAACLILSKVFSDFGVSFDDILSSSVTNGKKVSVSLRGIPHEIDIPEDA